MDRKGNKRTVNEDIQRILESDSDDHSDSSWESSAEESDDDDVEILEECDDTPKPVEQGWRRARMEEPQVHGFLGRDGLKDNGLRVDTNGFTPIAYFNLFLNDKLINDITTETNRYAQEIIRQSNLKPCSRLRDWRETTETEMRQFIGLLLLMALNRKPEIQMYWSKDVLLSSTVFPTVMSRDRFQILLRCWHFSNNANAPRHDNPNADRLFKIRPFLEALSASFQSVYKPDICLSLDEELVLWKGRLMFRQHIPLKRARFGIKIYCLCESNGYTYRFQVYTGKSDPNQDIHTPVPDDARELSKTERMVIHLLEPLLDKGYHLYTDNFYTSVELYSYLDEHSTGCCGTMRTNRVPGGVRYANVPKGDTAAFRNGNLLCMKFRDKRDVFMLTNMHKETTSRKRIRGRHECYVKRPDCVSDYNCYMGGVDKLDQMLSPYDATRKTLKWYKKIVIHFIQVSLFNAFLLYKINPANHKARFLKFELDVIKSLIYVNVDRGTDVPKDENVARLTERHFLTYTPETQNGGPKKLRLTRRCKVCSKNGIRREISYICSGCPNHPALCAVPCFELYHTKANY